MLPAITAAVRVGRTVSPVIPLLLPEAGRLEETPVAPDALELPGEDVEPETPVLEGPLARLVDGAMEVLEVPELGAALDGGALLGRDVPGRDAPLLPSEVLAAPPLLLVLPPVVVVPPQLPHPAVNAAKPRAQSPVTRVCMASVIVAGVVAAKEIRVVIPGARAREVKRW
jgi:hypothetical protein